MRRLRPLAPASLALLAIACTATIPEGRLVCADGSECPPGWSCGAGVCVSTPIDAGLDAAIDRDAGPDAGPAPDGGPGDAGPIDGGPPDAGPPDAGPPEVLVAVAAGEQHSCALGDRGRVWCWGANDQGQIGDDTTARRTSAFLSPTLADVDAICAGNQHTCALTGGGEIWCWGSNARGQVGASDVAMTYDAPVSVVASGASAIACGGAHTCAIVSGELWCWGDNGAGQIGDGTYMQRSMPVRVTMPPADVTALAAGSSHTCALTSAGVAHCWGYNGSGQLGDMETPVNILSSRATPAAVDTTMVLAAIEAGASHTCAITVDRDVLCWGANGNRQLGDTMGTERPVPMGIVALGGADVDAISAGGAHTCSLAEDAPTCWGRNHRGQIGNDTTTPFADAPPTLVSFLFPSPVIAIAAGGSHTCAIEARRALCWGENTQGQLGNRTTADADTPIEVMDLVLSP